METTFAKVGVLSMKISQSKLVNLLFHTQNIALRPTCNMNVVAKRYHTPCILPQSETETASMQERISKPPTTYILVEINFPETHIFTGLPTYIPPQTNEKRVFPVGLCGRPCQSIKRYFFPCLF